jgi:hypothetical protein
MIKNKKKKPVQLVKQNNLDIFATAVDFYQKKTTLAFGVWQLTSCCGSTKNLPASYRYRKPFHFFLQKFTRLDKNN